VILNLELLMTLRSNRLLGKTFCLIQGTVNMTTTITNKLPMTLTLMAMAIIELPSFEQVFVKTTITEDLTYSSSGLTLHEFILPNLTFENVELVVHKYDIIVNVLLIISFGG